MARSTYTLIDGGEFHFSVWCGWQQGLQTRYLMEKEKKLSFLKTKSKKDLDPFLLIAPTAFRRWALFCKAKPIGIRIVPMCGDHCWSSLPTRFDVYNPFLRVVELHTTARHIWRHHCIHDAIYVKSTGQAWVQIHVVHSMLNSREASARII